MRIVSDSIKISTRGLTDVKDITQIVVGKVMDSSIAEGIVFLSVVGSTASLTTIEYEPALVGDFKRLLEKLIPSDESYEHDETWNDANGHSHLRASMLGSSVTLPVSQRKVDLGTWQQIVLVDFDARPRERTVIVKIIGK